MTILLEGGLKFVPFIITLYIISKSSHATHREESVTIENHLLG